RMTGQETIYFADDFPEPVKSLNIDAGIRSCLSFSMVVDGKGYGSLVFSDSAPTRRQWNHGDIETLRTLARLVATAATRANNIEQRERAVSGLLLRDRALEGISQGVTITDDKAPGTPIIYTNPAFAALTRYTLEEVVGRGPLSFFDADVAPRIIERMAQAAAAKKPWRMETSLKRKDGTSFLDSMVTTMIVDQKGDITHSVTIHEDVTEVRQREELLLEAQKMESVGQLTGGIAHDFNNLLTAIKSNAEDLRDDLKDSPILQSQAEIVLEAADRGAGLVAQLMAFARKQELQPKVVDVNALLERFTKLLRSTLPAHVDIDIRNVARLPAIYVDPGRLETAILNLAVNARDAMADGGTVTIETSLKTLDADYVAEHIEVQQGDYVLIAVTDTGTGMPADVVERAFVPFFTTKEVGKGTGLGLSMVYGFVKQSGGHARIYSEVGLGTVVKIYLPALDQAAPSEDQPANGNKAKPGTGSILLVEDDPIVRQSISGKLTRLGYQVVTASNALDAIETLKSNPHFDLVFSDVIMPGPMNGADLVREVRRRWPAMNVLLTSGYTESTVLGKVTLPADVHLLSKPYSNSELAKVIGEAICGSSGDTA
ncbi:MAG: hybrid sensor histidine kinase/response regulator, partial [Rhodospirillaceae bacterium]